MTIKFLSKKKHCRTVDPMHWPVEFFHLHAGIENYFHHGGQGIEIWPVEFFHLHAEIENNFHHGGHGIKILF